MSSHFQSIIRVSLGLMFGLSVVGKIVHPKQFVRGVKEYKILHSSFARTFAIFVILGELLLASGHLAGQMLFASYIAGIVLLSIFFLAISINLARKRRLPCFCFGGPGDEMISARSLTRLAIAMVGEVTLLFQYDTHKPVSFASWRDAMLIFTWSMFILVCCIWLLSLPDLITMSRNSLYKTENQGVTIT